MIKVEKLTVTNDITTIHSCWQHVVVSPPFSALQSYVAEPVSLLLLLHSVLADRTTTHIRVCSMMAKW